MKRVLLLLAALLSLLPAVSQADISIGVNVPGLSLQIGDRDGRGHYWDGYRWREPRWWHERYQRREYYAPPPRGIYYGPPPREWRGRPHHYRMPPPPQYYRMPPPRDYHYREERGPRR